MEFYQLCHIGPEKLPKGAPHKLHCNQKGAKLKEYETDPKNLQLSQDYRHHLFVDQIVL